MLERLITELLSGTKLIRLVLRRVRLLVIELEDDCRSIQISIGVDLRGVYVVICVQIVGILLIT